MPIKVKVQNNNLEGAILAFRSKVKSAGILEEYNERKEYIKPSAKKRAARKKRQRCQKDK